MDIKEMTLSDVEARLAECDSIRETSENAEDTCAAALLPSMDLNFLAINSSS